MLSAAVLASVAMVTCIPSPWRGGDEDLPIPPPASLVAADGWVDPQCKPAPYPAPPWIATNNEDFPIPTPASLVAADGWINAVAPIPFYPVPWVATEEGDIIITPIIADDMRIGPFQLRPIGTRMPAPWKDIAEQLPINPATLRVEDEVWVVRVPYVAPWGRPVVWATDEDYVPVKDNDGGWSVGTIGYGACPVSVWLDDGEIPPQPIPSVLFDEGEWTSGVLPIAAYPVPWVASDDGDLPITSPLTVDDSDWTVSVAPIAAYPVPWVATDDGSLPIAEAAPSPLTVEETQWTSGVAPIAAYPVPWVATDDCDLGFPLYVEDNEWTSGVAPIASYPVPWVASDDGDLPIEPILTVEDDQSWQNPQASVWTILIPPPPFSDPDDLPGAYIPITGMVFLLERGMTSPVLDTPTMIAGGGT